MRARIIAHFIVAFFLICLQQTSYAVILKSHPTTKKKPAVLLLKKTSPKRKRVLKHPIKKHHTKKILKKSQAHSHVLPLHSLKRKAPHKNKALSITSSKEIKSSLTPPTLEQKLVHFVRQTISSLRYSIYKLGGRHIDTSRGVYIVDCSAYVDHILKSVYPHAYSYLKSWSGSEKPTTNDFYRYFMHLNNNTHAAWNSIHDVEQLRAGDILVFRYKNSIGQERGGHVMIVMDKPLRHLNTFAIRVSDSASGAHSKDTRTAHTSGIGIGTLLLKTDPFTYKPYAYAWKIGSHWDSHVNVAMGRPIGGDLIDRSKTIF